MRFETVASFIRRVSGEFDPKTGNYLPDTLECFNCPVTISPLTIQTQNELFGQVSTGSLYVLSLWKVPIEFDFIEINKKRYRVQSEERFRTRSGYYVLEVPDEY